MIIIIIIFNFTKNTNIYILENRLYSKCMYKSLIARENNDKIKLTIYLLIYYTILYLVVKITV